MLCMCTYYVQVLVHTYTYICTPDFAGLLNCFEGYTDMYVTQLFKNEYFHLTL